MATALAPLAHIREQMKTQDNACTAHPIFVVFNKKRIYGMDPEFGDDNYAWIASDEFLEADARQAQVCDRYERIFGQNPPGWDKRYYVEIDEFVTCAFTRKAAEAFIARKRHDYRLLHIYVESLYRMQEMITVREAILSGRFQEVA